MEAFFLCLLASIMWLLHLPGAILFPRALYGTFLHLSWALFWNFRLWISAGIFFHSYARYTVGYFNLNDLQGMTFVKEWPSQITLPEGLFILNFSNHAFNFQRVLACVSIVLFFKIILYGFMHSISFLNFLKITFVIFEVSSALFSIILLCLFFLFRWVSIFPFQGSAQISGDVLHVTHLKSMSEALCACSGRASWHASR